MKQLLKRHLISPLGGQTGLVRGILYTAALLLLTEGCFSTPFQSRKTTIFGTVTDNDTKLPVDSVQILISGEKGNLTSNADDLLILYTDKQGNYSVTIDIPKGYHSVYASNLYFNKFSYSKKYRSYLVFNNGQQTMNCCRVDIGSKTQYDFIMVPQ